MSEPAIEPVDGEPVEPAEETWAGPSQEEWTQTQQQLKEAAELVQAVRAAQQPSTDPLAEYDPEFVSAIDQRIAQKMTPYQQYQEQAEAERAEEALRDMFHDVSVRDGEFDAEMARFRYERVIGQMVQKHGQTIKAAEEAVALAARAQRDYETQIRTAAVEQYQNGMRGLRNAPVEPAVNGVAAAQQHVTPEGGDERDLVRSYFPSARG